MPAYDAGFKIAARTSGRRLVQVAGVLADEWEPIVGEVHATERLADRAFRARIGRERFVVYMEAYTRWDRAAPWNVLAKSGLLSERERLPTLSLLYVLLPRGYRPQDGTFRLSVQAAPTQQIWFREICLWEQEPEDWWQESPGLMALYPLTRHRRPRREAVTFATHAITEHEADPIIRADLLATLAIFGKLVYPDMDVVNLIGREHMKESKVIQEFQAEASSETRRADIRKVLEARFSPEAAVELDEAIRTCDNPEQLAQLFDTALLCRTLAEFRRALRPAHARR